MLQCGYWAVLCSLMSFGMWLPGCCYAVDMLSLVVCDLLWGCYSALGGCQGVAMQLQSCSELLLLLWSYKFVIFGCQCFNAVAKLFWEVYLHFFMQLPRCCYVFAEKHNLLMAVSPPRLSPWRSPPCLMTGPCPEPQPQMSVIKKDNSVSY